ncbi:hypothetical protein BH11BAC3_BH11BAC3_45130 [soil metagenome]
MKTAVTFLVVSLCFTFPVLAQFPMHNIFPDGVIGISDAEILLNKKEVLLRAGIKKVTAHQSSPEAPKTFTSKSIYVNYAGNIDSIIEYYPMPHSFYSKIQYLCDTSARLTEFRMYYISNNISKMTFKTLYEYSGENKVIKITNFNLLGLDTDTAYKYFNQKGQLVRWQQIINGMENTNALFYYNKDGQLDSISYANANLPTNVFKTTKKGKLKMVKSAIGIANFTWTFNSSDQCITTSVAPVNKAARNIFKHKMVHYYYNVDGTLSYVTEKFGGKPTHSMIYSYSK